MQPEKIASGLVSWKYPLPISVLGMWVAMANTGAPLR